MAFAKATMFGLRKASRNSRISVKNRECEKRWFGQFGEFNSRISAILLFDLIQVTREIYTDIKQRWRHADDYKNSSYFPGMSLERRALRRGQMKRNINFISQHQSVDTLRLINNREGNVYHLCIVSATNREWHLGVGGWNRLRPTTAALERHQIKMPGTGVCEGRVRPDRKMGTDTRGTLSARNVVWQMRGLLAWAETQRLISSRAPLPSFTSAFRSTLRTKGKRIWLDQPDIRWNIYERTRIPFGVTRILCSS